MFYGIIKKLSHCEDKILAKKTQEATDIVRKRRLQGIQKLHEKIKKNEDISNISRLTKVAYILWQYPNTRNSDRTHAIQYYKIFHPEYVKNDLITFENLYNLPKMYDLQRDRATIQNTEELFPAKIEIGKKRQIRASEYKSYYKNNNPKNYVNDTKYYIYLDESGKNNKYFVLAGILINSYNVKKILSDKLSKIKQNLNKKYNLKVNEWKFSNINHKNKNYYLELIEKIKNTGLNITFISIFVENNGLCSDSKKNKTKELFKFIIKDCLDLLTLYTCRSSYENVISKLNATLDNDGAGIDIIQQEQIKREIQTAIGTESKYFSTLENLNWEDSKNNNFIQIADLYASSLNNIFSDMPIESENSQAKKDFANKILEQVGISNIFNSRGKCNNFEFLNKCLSKNEIPEDFKM